MLYTNLAGENALECTIAVNAKDVCADILSAAQDAPH
jgi:hypothetical protein